MGSALTIVQTHTIRNWGSSTRHIVTDIFVDRVLHVPYGDPGRSEEISQCLHCRVIQTYIRQQMAKAGRRHIPEGWFVISYRHSDCRRRPRSLDREVIFHSENGVLMGPAPEEDKSSWLINAGKQYIRCARRQFCHHADSFSMIRAGIGPLRLGAFQVADNGDIANWATSRTTRLPPVGGAMDLAAGAKRLWVL